MAAQYHNPSSSVVRGVMSKLVRIMLALLLLVLVGGGVFLITWDIPAPTARIEKPIPNDRFK